MQPPTSTPPAQSRNPHRVCTLHWRRPPQRIVALIALLGMCVIALGFAVRASAQSQDDIIKAGLEAWRKPDQNGMACANCHSPDGIEIARYNFSDEDIRRRDAFHLERPDSDKIVAMIHALRDKHNLNDKLLDPMEDRPLQPGGAVLPGATAQERDLAFARTLVTKLPGLFNGPIDSFEKARQARNELIAFDTRKEPVGVPFPRLSEDIHHGPEHGLLNDWLADMPQKPRDAQAQAEWFALQDTYLANPSAANFWAMYKATDTLFDKPKGRLAEKLSMGKYRALLQLQHVMREEVTGRSEISAQYPVRFLEVPPAATRKDTQIHDAIHTVGGIVNNGIPGEIINEYPQVVRDGLNPQHLEVQKNALTTPWWYAGWIDMPCLPHVANRQEYFPGVLADGNKTNPRTPYLVHSQFVRIKMTIACSYQPWQRRAGEAPKTDGGLGLANIERGIANYKIGAQSAMLNQEHKQLYETFVANVRRMQLHLLIDALDQQCAAGRPYRNWVGSESSFLDGLEKDVRPSLHRVDPAFAATDDVLIDSAVRKLQEARNGCQPIPPAGNGTGVQVEFFPDETFSGTPTVRTDSRISYGEGKGPDPRKWGSPTAVRWTAQVQPLFSNEYTFSVSGVNINGPNRLWVNGKLVIDTTNRGSSSGKIQLEAGQTYDLRMEHTAPRPPIALHLYWSSPQQVSQFVPTSQLYPPANAPAPTAAPAPSGDAPTPTAPAASGPQISGVTGLTSGQAVSGTVALIANVTGADIVQVVFDLSGPQTAQHIERFTPYVFMGNLAGGKPLGWDTTTLPDGEYVLKVTATDRQGQSSVLETPFTIANGAATSP